MPSSNHLKKLRLKKKRTKDKADASASTQPRSRRTTQTSSVDNGTLRAPLKKPKEMTAAEISSAIADIDTQIGQSKALLPADAGPLQRALFTLKLALLKAGGVEPELAVKDRDALESLIAEKRDAAAPEPAALVDVAKAAATVDQAHAAIDRRNPASQDPNPSPYPGLDLLRQKKPSELSVAEVNAALSDIDRSIAESKLLLPENASKLQRALYTLKLALLNLGDVTPQMHYEIQEQLNIVLDERQQVS